MRRQEEGEEKNQDKKEADNYKEDEGEKEE